jgi:hypothetical protein
MRRIDQGSFVIGLCRNAFTGETIRRSGRAFRVYFEWWLVTREGVVPAIAVEAVPRVNNSDEPEARAAAADALLRHLSTCLPSAAMTLRIREARQLVTRLAPAVARVSSRP